MWVLITDKQIELVYIKYVNPSDIYERYIPSKAQLQVETDTIIINSCLLSSFFLKPVPTALAQVDREKIYQWINELSSPETRENALLELSKKRESVPDLAPMLWHSFGTIAALLQVGLHPWVAIQSSSPCSAFFPLYLCSVDFWRLQRDDSLNVNISKDYELFVKNAGSWILCKRFSLLNLGCILKSVFWPTGDSEAHGLSTSLRKMALGLLRRFT